MESEKGNIPWVILVVLLLVSMSIAGYFYWQNKQSVNLPVQPTQDKRTETEIPTANPASDWKTYTDAKNGFEFKYPQNWYIEEYMPGLIAFFEVGTKANHGGGESGPGNMVFKVQIIDNISLDNIKRCEDQNVPKSIINFLGARSLRISTDTIDIELPNGKVLGLNGNLLDQILSTFKFLISRV